MTSQAMRIVPVLLLIMSVPLGAQPAAPAEPGIRTIPQPVVLDWAGQFRLSDPPNNADETRLKAAAAAGEARHRYSAEAAPPSRAQAALGVEDRTTTRTSYRRLESDGSTLNVKAPVKSGPVSLGASYGGYRAVPDTGDVSAHDMRVSLGVAF